MKENEKFQTVCQINTFFSKKLFFKITDFKLIMWVKYAKDCQALLCQLRSKSYDYRSGQCMNTCQI